DAFTGPAAVAASVSREGSIAQAGPPPVTMSDLVHAELARQQVINQENPKMVERPAKDVLPEAAVAAAVAAAGADNVADCHAVPAVPSVYKKKHLSMLCRFCGLPLTADGNGHVKDGSRFGRCPRAPLPDEDSIAIKNRGRERAKSLVVLDNDTEVDGKRKRQGCSFCGLWLSATIRDPLTDILLDPHERFSRSDGTLVWYCPVAENLSTEEVIGLRNLKIERRKANQQRKNGRRK
ncbi:hypothetical protein FOL47_004329, partial [Perkinsus chesapeaki]